LSDFRRVQIEKPQIDTLKHELCLTTQCFEIEKNNSRLEQFEGFFELWLVFKCVVILKNTYLSFLIEIRQALYFIICLKKQGKCRAARSLVLKWQV
jgi:hypothetical protein